MEVGQAGGDFTCAPPPTPGLLDKLTEWIDTEDTRLIDPQ